MDRALADAGNLGQAEVLARSIANPWAEALAAVAGVLARVRDLDRARQVTHQAEALARSTHDPWPLAKALAAVAGVLADVGDLDRARQVAQQAESLPCTASKLIAWRLTWGS